MAEAELSAMPLLIINMGGEMLYILDQRLKAQKIPEDKGMRVHQDVMSTMFSEQFIKELFKPQKIYSNSSTRLIFDRLAHSSIMRLNESSMNKLYDLMTMGCKYQVLAATHPEQLEHVSMNHLEALKKMVQKPEVIGLLEAATTASTELFRHMSPGDWILLRQTLARFFQDRRVKVSLFLHDGIQSSDGSIVINHKGPLPPGAEKPGAIRYFDDDGKVSKEKTIQMKNATELADPVKRSALGENLYAKDRRKKDRNGIKAHKHAPTDKEKPFEPDEASAKAATAELNALADFLGGTSGKKAGKDKFTLSQLFPDSATGGSGGGGHSEEAIVFDNEDAKDYKKYLDNIWGAEEKANDDDEDEDDLLDLMDMADIRGAATGNATVSGGALGPSFNYS